MNKFWNWSNSDEGRTLYFDGYIAADSWYDDDITPKKFKSELTESTGDISVWLNSPGGDALAASQIYTMLKEYNGKVTVKIDGLAASAASVVAMAGDEVVMSPTACIMVHNPATMIFGEAADFQSGIKMLSEIKESIINAYEQKTGLSRAKIASMMDAETWFSAQKAVELGFADKILYAPEQVEATEGFIFDKITVTNALRRKLPKEKQESEAQPQGVPHQELLTRLNLLK
ncbi:ATP-dependent Clp protease proteolytic subunit 1 [Sporomusa ovata DSM 2662]|uniref:ATP-dependent Clp protease proteolytic subunit n=1 Tax=Sporomusa ovata TaxID=2378 RepID=A0A0U1L5K7_9FIRM|nr:head maturation protease, ClpP-related [Sporomusa ovata]EQB24620.1 peptidase S14 ClpP [Sporomusa ovata DSM 2662]CQR74967.1 Prophage Clp protease-like protein [Sporomusa ovata]